MCGITGYLYFNAEQQVDINILKVMTNTLNHRGPDGEGYYIHENVALGHRRLSIIDLNTGDQPIYNEDKSLVIIMNGEIYNYIELRNELKEKGYHFKTKSDTEVALKAYEEWGYDCQNKFNGMWAFVIWDDRKKTLFLSRDRIGEKPLFYAVYNNSFVFGSEIKSLLKYGVPAEPDLEFLEIYLALGYVPAPFTMYKNIRKLCAASYLIVEDGQVEEKRYWDLPKIDESAMLSDKTDIYTQFRELLKDSVRLRMRSDVPFGAFLSGGLDSSAVVAVMSENTELPVETFTIGFREKEYDERSLAGEVALKYHTNHHEHIVAPDSFEESLQKVLYHYDEPFGDSSSIPTGYVSKFASEKVKMVLTGDGGDEVLSGYTAYQGEKFSEHYVKIPGFIRMFILFSLNNTDKLFSGNIRYKLNRIKNVCESSEMDFISRRQAKYFWLEKSLIKSLTENINVYPVEEYFNDFFSHCTYKDNFYKLMYFHLKLSLPNDMLVKVDRMSMAYSLETRVPFLDHRLVEFMVKAHKNIKMQGYERKSVLRNSMKEYFPEKLLSAPKRGFAVPVREWFKDKAFENHLGSLINTDWTLNKESVKEIVQSNKEGKKDYGNFLWMLFLLKEWLNQ